MINVSPEAKQKALLFLSKNQKIAAVKVIKDFSGCGLKEAKDYVDGLEEVQQPITNVVDLDAEILVILNQGNKLKAIKHYKDATGLGLAESKDYVEKLMQFKGSSNITQQSRDTDINIIAEEARDNQNPLKNFLIKLLIIIMVAAALTYFMFKI